MIFRSIGIWLCGWIYPIIPRLYAIFYSLSSAKFFNDEDSILDELSSNIYVLVSVVMLFIFSATFLSAIINPDIINDKKKGIGAMLKRAFVGIILIILIPFCFDEAYKIQNSVIENHLVEKILVGIDYSDADTTTPGGNGGQVVAGTLLGSVLYPREDGIEVTDDIGDLYSDMITKDIDNIDEFGDYINIAPAGNSKYKTAFEFQGLVAIIAGIGACYILLLFAMDMAVRLFTLAFYELTAPISVVAYMAVGDDQLKRWLNAVGATLIDVYIRIAAMSFYIFLLSRLNSFLEGAEFQSVEWVGLLRVLLIIGMLIFVKKVPDLINGAFGTKLKTQGGIGGRLGQMALAGGIAKKAWDKTKSALGRAALAPAALAGAGIGYGANKLWNGNETGKFKGLKNTKVGNAIGHAGAYVGGGLKGAKKYHDNSQYVKDKKAEKAAAVHDNFRKKLNTTAGGTDEIMNKYGQIADGRGEEAHDAIRKQVKGDNVLSNKQAQKTQELMDAKSYNASLDQIKGSKTKITEKLQEEANGAKSDAARRRIQDLETDFNAGNLSADEFAQNIKQMVKDKVIAASTGKVITTNLDKITNTIDNNKELFAEHGVNFEKDGKLKVNATKNAIADAERLVAEAQSSYDEVLNSASAEAKATMKEYISTSDRIDKKVKYERSHKKEGSTREQYHTDEIYNEREGQIGTTSSSSSGGSSGGSSGSSSTGGSSGGSSGSSSTGGSSGGSSGSSSSGGSSGSSSGSSSTGGNSGSSSGSSSTGGSSGSSSSSSSQDYSDQDIMDMMSNAQIADAENTKIQQQTDATGDFYQDVFDAQYADSTSNDSQNGGTQSSVDDQLFRNDDYAKIVNNVKNGTTSGTYGSSTYDAKQTENGTEITFHTIQGNDSTIIVDDQGFQTGNVDSDGKVTMIPNADGTPRKPNRSSDDTHNSSGNEWQDMMDLYDDED